MAEKFSDWVAKTLPTLPKRLQNSALLVWNQDTQEALSKSIKKAPFTLGGLRSSMDRIKAKITSRGLVSAIVATVPYAYKLHFGDVRLKKRGETSYYINGKPMKKREQGEKEFINKGISDTESLFIKDLKKAIGKEWVK